MRSSLKSTFAAGLMLSSGLLLQACAHQAAEPLSEEAAAAEIKLYVLDCGRINMDNGMLFSDSFDYDGQPLSLVDSCYLIQHPKGLLLWDTGLADGLVGQEPYNPPGTPLFLSKNVSLVSQLEQIGISPEAVNYVGISHMHFDHSANANLFKQATLLLQKSEYDYTHSKPTPFGFNPADIASFTGERLKKLQGDHDVFGDGSVQILSMPGHTPGHQALLVRLQEAGNILLSGDLYHLRENFEERRVPRLQYDRADYIASFDRMERILDATDGRLIVQHDKGDFEALPKAPAFLH